MFSPIVRLLKIIKRKLKKIFSSYSSKFVGVYCPICNNYFEKFNPAGLIPRENAECPNCRSRERHRLLYLFLQSKKFLFKKKKNFNFLHIAPAESLYNKFKTFSFLNYYPCDLNPEEYNHFIGPKVRSADLTELPFKAEKFDFIMCNHVLEHIENDKKALAELYRVMKPGGKGIFLVPIIESLENTYEDFSIVSPVDREKAFGQSDHVRVCGKDYINRYSDAGFVLVVSSFGTNFSNKKRYKYGLLKAERIYFCVK